MPFPTPRPRPLARAVPAVAALLALLAAAACAGSRSADAPAADAAPAPPDLLVVVGEGGGFAGRWTGYRIAADGAVDAWTRALLDERYEPAGRLAPDDLDALWRRLDDADVFARDDRETGNITAFLELRADGRTHRVSWVPGLEGLEPARTPLDSLYRYVRRLAREAPPAGRDALLSPSDHR